MVYINQQAKHRTNKSSGETAYVDDLTQEKNFAGTGNGEHITATSSNQYICTEYNKTPPTSAMTTNAQTALSDIDTLVQTLTQNSQSSIAAVNRDSEEYHAALTAAQDAATRLEAATTAAKADTQLCSFVGILNSGASQLKTLSTRLSDGQATDADIAAAKHYADVVREIGIK